MAIPLAKAPFAKQGAKCDLCPLKGEKAVPPELRPGAKLVIVGEGPGKTEEKVGAPFRGVSGQFLERLLSEESRLKRNEVSLTNSALCRGENDDDKKLASACCAPRLLAELGKSKAPIIPLGALAVGSVLGLAKIFLVRGFLFEAPAVDVTPFQRAVLKAPVGSPTRRKVELAFATAQGRAALVGKTVLPSLHPVFVLRSETWHPIIRTDFRRLGRLARGQITQLADRGSHKVSQEVKSLAHLGPVVSLDVETTHAVSPYLAKLLCVGLSDGKQSVVLWPWDKRMAMPLSKWLKTRRAVVGHNLMNFDRVVLEEAGVK